MSYFEDHYHFEVCKNQDNVKLEDYLYEIISRIYDPQGDDESLSNIRKSRLVSMTMGLCATFVIEESPLSFIANSINKEDLELGLKNIRGGIITRNELFNPVNYFDSKMRSRYRLALNPFITFCDLGDSYKKKYSEECLTFKAQRSLDFLSFCPFTYRNLESSKTYTQDIGFINSTWEEYSFLQKDKC